MADYRLDCCGGFPNHLAGCPSIQREIEYERERRLNEETEQKKWDDFFSGMSHEQLFLYTELCQKELDRLHKFRLRRDKAMDYMRRKHIATKFLDWKREK